MIIDFLDKIEANYEIFNDGKALMNRVENIDLNEVGVVITDIEMPGADGYEVASFMKENSKYSNIPVIINSSMTTNAVKSRMAKIGADAFVGKTEIDRLYAVIKNHLS